MKQTQQMGDFIRRVVDAHGGQVTNEDGLQGFVPYYLSLQPSPNYVELCEQLATEKWLEGFTLKKLRDELLEHLADDREKLDKVRAKLGDEVENHPTASEDRRTLAKDREVMNAMQDKIVEDREDIAKIRKIMVGIEGFKLKDARDELVQELADDREKLFKDRERLKEEIEKQPTDHEERQQLAQDRQEVIADQEKVAEDYHQIDKVRKHMLAKADEEKVAEEQEKLDKVRKHLLVKEGFSDAAASEA